jgi:hypothetical protein
VEIRKSSRITMFPTCYDDFVVASVEAPYGPIDFLKVLKSHAWQIEMESIRKNQTWELVQLPVGKKPIISKWVYKIKNGINGKLEKYKA